MAKRFLFSHFIHVFVKTNLLQHKKVYLIKWLSGLWLIALENPKVEVFFYPISLRIKESQILFCQNRVENPILIILKPDE